MVIETPPLPRRAVAAGRTAAIRAAIRRDRAAIGSDSIAPLGVCDSRAQPGAGTERARSHGTTGSAGVAQCHIQTGYSSSTTPVRVHAAAAARPTASWSGCPSPRQVAAHQVSGPAVRRISTSDSVSRSSWSASSPSGRPSRIGGATPKAPVALRNSYRRVVAKRIRPDSVTPGWAAPPSLTDTTRTSAPDATSCAVIAPRPRVSSSGWGATTIRRRHSVKSSGGRGPHSKAASHTRRRGAAVGQWLGREPGAVAVRRGSHGVLTAGGPRGARARRDPARRGFAGCRCSGRRPAGHAVRPDRAGPAPARGRCG